MKISKYTVGPFAENTYLLRESGMAILIDPGFNKQEEFDAVQEVLEDQSTELLAIVLTHAHVDHILGINYVLNSYEVPVFLSDKDRYLWDNYGSQAQMFGFRVDPINATPQRLPITKNWSLGPFSFEIRFTPGHAPDHVVLYSAKDELVMAGDTLFKEGIGRTDLYKGSFNRLEASIREQLYTLPDQAVIYPGHGPKTTVGHEKQNNPFIKE